MIRIFATLILTCFSIWILPLGVFIAPSKEKLACGGQRAICLCSHMMGKKQPKETGKALIKNVGSAEHKEGSSPGGASYYLLHASLKQNNILQNIAAFDQEHFFYTCQYYRSIEHVPKV